MMPLRTNRLPGKHLLFCLLATIPVMLVSWPADRWQRVTLILVNFKRLDGLCRPGRERIVYFLRIGEKIADTDFVEK